MGTVPELSDTFLLCWTPAGRLTRAQCGHPRSRQRSPRPLQRLLKSHVHRAYYIKCVNFSRPTTADMQLCPLEERLLINITSSDSHRGHPGASLVPGAPLATETGHMTSLVLWCQLPSITFHYTSPSFLGGLFLYHSGPPFSYALPLGTSWIPSLSWSTTTN